MPDCLPNFSPTLGRTAVDTLAGRTIASLEEPRFGAPWWAGELGIEQENVSRIERRSDILLPALNGYLRGMGGRLRLVAEFDVRPPAELSGFTSVADPTTPARR